jgi:hypothetical protein
MMTVENITTMAGIMLVMGLLLLLVGGAIKTRWVMAVSGLLIIPALAGFGMRVLLENTIVESVLLLVP